MAYLWSRYKYEAKKAIGDTWLSSLRRSRVAILYIKVGKDFNKFMESLYTVPPSVLYIASVHALEIFRDNLDVIWCYAYSGNLREIIWLSKEKKQWTETFLKKL
jgi:hypothetical protein